MEGIHFDELIFLHKM